jgi:DNA-binding MarR family transcriptional regulator
MSRIEEQQLLTLIERYETASLAVTRRMAALLRDTLAADLTLDQYNILRYIKQRRGCTSSELSDAYCVGKSAITAIINRMVQKGLIRRTQDRKDRRVTRLSLTREGERLCEALTGRIQDILSRYLSNFSQEEAAAFIGTFEKLARLLDPSNEGREGAGAGTETARQNRNLT